MDKFEFKLKHEKTGKEECLVLTFPEEKVHLAELVPAFRRLYDAIAALEMDGESVSCRKGCSACCRQLVPLSPPEAFALEKVTEKLPEAHRDRIKKRIRKYKNQVNQAGLYKEGNVPTDRDYFLLGLECPFLEEKKCSIYDQRPLICREYNVLTPPELCLDPYINIIDKVKLSCHMGVLMTALASALWAIPPRPVPLIYLFDYTEKNRIWEKFVFPGKWTAGKMMNGVREVLKGIISIDISPELA